MSMNDGFYAPEELRKLGIKEFGDNVRISRKASLYMPERMTFGHDIRVDDFALLIGNIHVGNFVHIASHTGLHASSGSITLDDFVGIASHSVVFASSDDYSGEFMTNPLVPDEYVCLNPSDIRMGRHCVIGVGSVILPGAVIPEGVSVGAMTLIKGQLEPWKIYIGIPCRPIADRKKHLLELEQAFMKSIESEG